MSNWRYKLSHWWSSRKTLSAYFDMALTSAEHRRVWKHVHHCHECREEVDQLADMREELRQIPAPMSLPADLSFNIRLRLAQERYRAQRPSFWWRVRTQLQPFAVQAFSGTISAMLIFALFTPELAVPNTVYQNDIPIEWSTPARLVAMGPVDLGNDPEDIVVQVLIDPHGRVADYTILAGKYTQEDVRELRNRLTFTVFNPATFHGRPTAELRLISFSSVRVRG